MSNVIKQIKVGNQIYKLQDSVITENGTDFIFGAYDDEGYLIGSITIPEINLYNNLKIQEQDSPDSAELTLSSNNGLITKKTLGANIIIEGKQSGIYPDTNYPDEFIEYFSIKETVENKDYTDEETGEIIDTETVISHSLYLEGDATIDGTLKTNKIENHSIDGGIVIGSGSASGTGTVALGDSAANGNYSLAEGYKTIAGCNGYYISAICPKNPTSNEGYIFLTNEQLTTPPAWITDEKDLNYWDSTITLDYNILNDTDATLNNYVSNGNKFCISSNAYYHWTLAGDMTAINYNRIKYTSDTLNSDEKWLMNKDDGADPMVFFIPAQPNAGTASVGLGSHAEGWESHAAAEHTHAEGYATLAAARYGHAEGRGSIAGYSAHAEGQNTEALGFYSHSEGANTKALNSGAHAEGEATEAKGKNSHAEGLKSIAIGAGAHAEGRQTIASGVTSHAEGVLTQAQGRGSHAEGGCPTDSPVEVTFPGHQPIVAPVAEGAYAHAEGRTTYAYGLASHSEGFFSYAGGDDSSPGAHAEGGYESWHAVEITLINNANQSVKTKLANVGTEANGVGAHAEGYRSTVFAKGGHAEGAYTVALGQFAHAEGSPYEFYSGNTPVGSLITTVASNTAAHAEGQGTYSGGVATHTEGQLTKAFGNATHAEGKQAVAEGLATHAEGVKTTAKTGLGGAHAEGYSSNVCSSTATGSVGLKADWETTKFLYAGAKGSHAEGIDTIAYSAGSHAQGTNNIARANNAFVSGLFLDSGTESTEVTVLGRYNATVPTNQLFIVGNGNSNARSNAFRINADGNAYAANSMNSTGADYAEYFEWSDGNPEAADRVGRFVSLDNGNQIKLASSSDEILGVISGHAAILGDAYEDAWNGMYDRDIYGRLQYEEVEVNYEEEDEDGNLITKTAIETHIKRNPNYDPTQTYIPRSERPEWAPVGLLGKLVVIDDGSCMPGGKCTCGINGTATASETGYHVLKRLDDTHIQILLK